MSLKTTTVVITDAFVEAITVDPFQTALLSSISRTIRCPNQRNDILASVAKSFAKRRGQVLTLSVLVFVYLRSALRFEAIKSRKKTRRTQLIEDPESLASSVLTPPQMAEATEEVIELFEAIRALRRSHRRTVRLLARGLSHQQCAELLGIAEDTWHKRVERARIALRREREKRSEDS